MKMLESYFYRQRNIGYVLTNLLKLIVLALSIQTIVLIVPTIVQKVEQYDANLQKEVQAIRIVSNSNYATDIQLKNTIAAQFNEQSDSLETFMERHYSSIPYKITTGQHIIPAKWQQQTFYPQNYYEATVLTLGSGRGNNWFCAMFRDACIERQTAKKPTVKFVFLEWFQKIRN